MTDLFTESAARGVCSCSNQRESLALPGTCRYCRRAITQDRAEEAKQDGMARAEAGAGDWNHTAYEAVSAHAHRHATLTTIEVRDAHSVPDPREPRAWGPVMKRAQRAGLIAPTMSYEPGDTVNHKRPVRVWRSLVSAT